MWYYTSGGVQQGPIGEEALRAMAAGGQLQSNDLVWRDGMEAWIRAGDVQPALFARAVPPPMPPVVANYYTSQPTEFADLGQNAGIRMLLPVGRSGYAIAAGYLGLLSVLLVFAPFALTFGIIAIRDIRKHPDRHGMGRAIFGIVMGVIGTIFLVILIVSLAFAPSSGRRGW